MRIKKKKKKNEMIAFFAINLTRPDITGWETNSFVFYI